MATKLTRKQEAAKYAEHLALRDALIEALGMAPETHRYPHPEGYCATTGELQRWLLTDYRKALA